MSYEEFEKNFKKLNKDLINSLYSKPKNKIIQDDITPIDDETPNQNKKNKTDYSLPKNQIIQDDITTIKDNTQNKNKNNIKNKNQINVLKLLQDILKNCKNTIKKIYNALIQNITLRNILSNICGFLIFVILWYSVIYCIITPYEKLNYFYLYSLAIIVIFSSFIEYRLRFIEIEVCPKCHENYAIREKELNNELINTYEFSDDEDIYRVEEYKYTYNQYCIYCDYSNIDIRYKEEKYTIGKTPFGKLREENMRHEEAMRTAYKEATDYRIQKEAEEWDRRMKGN